MTFYVYALLDPTKPGPFRYGKYVFPYEPFYVGKGSKQRVSHHAKGYDCKNSDKAKTIHQIQKLGFEVIEQIKHCNLSEEESFTKERLLISIIGLQRNGGPLLNKTVGGQGVSGYERDADWRKKKSDSVRAYHANLSDKEKSVVSLKKSDSLIKVNKTRTKKQKKSISANLKMAFATMSESDKLAKANKISKAQLSISEEERKKRFIRRSNGQRNKPVEVEQTRRARISETWNSRTPEQQKELSTKRTCLNLERNGVQVRYKGKLRYLRELCTELGLKYHTVYQRYFRSGWSLAEALT